MRGVKRFTSRMLAIMLTGALTVGNLSVSAFGTEIDVTVEDTSEMAAEEVVSEAEETVIEEVIDSEAVTYYTVTLDANGGYFENEWDDAIGEYSEQAEVVERHIPVDGTVNVVPMFNNSDVQSMVFAGWSLERDGELVSPAEEEYIPVDNCTLYAVWRAEDAALLETGEQEIADEGTEQEDLGQEATEEAESVEGTEAGNDVTEMIEEIGTSEESDTVEGAKESDDVESEKVTQEHGVTEDTDTAKEFEDSETAEKAETVQETTEDTENAEEESKNTKVEEDSRDTEAAKETKTTQEENDVEETVSDMNTGLDSDDDSNEFFEDRAYNNSVSFAGGNGTQIDPYQIKTAEQLDAVRNDLSAYYILVDNIDIGSYNWKSIGNVNEGFEGEFNGNGYSINNLTIQKQDGVSIYGLFNITKGTVKNVTLQNCDVNIQSLGSVDSYIPCVGTLCGRGYEYGKIYNCKTYGTINVSVDNSALVGGVVGYGSNDISGCENHVDIIVTTPIDTGESGAIQCGGIIGETGSVNGKISHCSNYGKINALGNTFCYCGGISGEHGSISECTNYGGISGSIMAYHGWSGFAANCNVGGIVGATSADVLDKCINYGSISASKTCENGSCYSGGVAGFIGYYGSGSITSCINAGPQIYAKDGSAGRVAGCVMRPANLYSLSSTLCNGEIPSSEKDVTEKNGQDIEKSELEGLINRIIYGANSASGKCGDNLTWILDEAGTLTISGTGKMTSAPWQNDYWNDIKSIIIETGVSNICESAFCGCHNLTQVMIPESVYNIQANAFAECEKLTNLSIPEGVTIIGIGAFYGCRNLTSVTIPNSVINVQDGAFQFCSSLQTVTLTESITEISPGLFGACSSLTEITIPNSVINIRYSAFQGCESLTSITIPANVKSIEAQAFDGCSGLKKVSFTGNAPTIASDVFSGVVATAYYLPNDLTWTKDVRGNYGGNITWIGFSEIEDFDGDGILDRWEEYGADVDGDGVVDINLPEMGADPFTPDIFVEIDWMTSLYPRATALKKVYDQFYAHGINLHIDAGPDSVDYVTGKKWGNLSGGNSIAYSDVFTLGNKNSNWKAKAKNNFSRDKWKVFRYCLFVNRYDAGRGTDSSGIADGIPGQFFIVADCDGWVSKTDTSQAGTFMHELGHTLGLRHGGSDDIHLKPNYLSVMNYLYQLSGLVGNNNINYSDYILPALNENNINEKSGLDPNGETDKGTTVGAKWYIKKGSVFEYYKVDNIARNSVDFNNNGVIENGLQEDINKDDKKSILSASINDWNNISFVGGVIGAGVSINPNDDLPMTINPDDELFDELTEELAYNLHLNPEDEQVWENVESVENPDVIDSGVCGENISWSLSNDGILSFAGTGEMTDYPYISASPWYSKTITNVIVGDGITRIGDYAFSDSTMTSISLPESLESIGSFAFYGLTGLETINIPIGVTSIDQGAFAGSSYKTNKITSITVDENNTNYSENDGVVYSEDGRILVAYPPGRLGEFSVPEGVRVIGDSAFSGCKGLTGILIPEGVTVIENLAFAATGMSDVTIPNTVQSIGKSAFANCRELKSVFIEGSVKTLKQLTFNICYNLQTIYLPESIEKIEQNTFFDCRSLKDVYFSGSERTWSKVVIEQGKVYDTYILDSTVHFAKENETIVLDESCVSIKINDQIWTGKPLIPVVDVKYENESITEGTDYEVSYANNTNVGTATVTITGAGYYTGTVSKTFKINAASITNATVIGVSNKTYTGSALTQNPTVTVGDKTLTKGTDYTVSYANNTNAGTATVTITGKNNYTGTKTATFKINKASQGIIAKSSSASVAIGKTAVISITGAKGTKSYKSSNTSIATVDSKTGKVTAKKVGTVKVTATSAATSNYNAASKTVTIKMIPAATSSITAANQATGIKLTWKKVTGATGYKVYRGSTLIKTIKSGSTVTCTDTKANTNSTKYTFKIIPTASTGNGTAKSLTTYRVARPAISSVKNSASKKMAVKWGKNAKANGYQIQYSTNKTFASGNKTATVTKAATVSKVIGSLTKGKTYYVRIRTYKTVGKIKYWSAWSAAKSVKISK